LFVIVAHIYFISLLFAPINFNILKKHGGTIMADDILREEGLPATTPRYQYQGVKQCLRCFELELERYDREGQHGDGLYVIFDHVDDRSFQECFEDDSAESLLVDSLATYNFISHTIVLKIPPSDVHEAAHRAFSEIFSTWHRGQESRLVPTGDAEVEGFTRKKKPDSSWKTSIHIPGRDVKWPTILVEAGWSEPMAKLKQDILFWLRESEQQVKVALTIQVTRRESVTIKQWVLDETTRSSVKPIQTMHITRNRDPRLNQHQISGSMRIPFEDCFLRAKRGNESDFVLSNEDLTELAEAVWYCLPE
jgi:hypothetical protein